jgi:4-hydroxy-2-oxoheptanedioate aldolase
VNAVKKCLREGRPAVGHWVSLACPAVTEILSGSGMDWLVFDMEHGPLGDETLEDLMRAMTGSGVTPLARVAGNDPVLIKKVLDRGVQGVVVPLVNSPEEALAAVAASRYPPEGIRGVAGTRANRYGAHLPQYFAEWNKDVLVACQVETTAALSQVEAIAAVPGVDILFLGPYDLSANLGILGQFQHPEFQRAKDQVLKAALDAGICAGYFASSAQEAIARIEEGFRFVAMGTDARLLARAAEDLYRGVRAFLDGWSNRP